ncbi:GGDEF domain-containing protein, partial [Klebsiella pneumoniae]
GLTGIANRRFFEARLGDEFARWQRYGGDLSVLLFDLDHFKTINDRFGHAAGDAVLRETARRVASIVRAQDTFGRFGGE